MTYARKANRFIQISNVEGTPGTAEAAVEVFSGVFGGGYADKVIHNPEEDRNSLSMYHANQLLVGREWNADISGDLNSRHAVWLFCNTVAGNITPTQPNATTKPNAYLWTIEPGITTANTPDITAGIDTFTIEVGDNQQAYESEFIFTRTLTIEGAPNGVVTYTWGVTGRQLTETTKTAALSMDTAFQRFPFNLAKFYVDTSVANWGTTQKTGLLLGFTVTFETQFTPLYATDGALYFTALNEDKKSVSVDLTFRRGTDSETEKDKYDALTTTFHRIELLGTTVLDAAQSNPPYIYIDYAGRYSEWSDLGDEGGSATESVSLNTVYDATGSKEYSIKIYTELSAYP
jgi:hypothetical protein